MADGAPLGTETDIPHLDIAYEKEQCLDDCRLPGGTRSQRGDAGVTFFVIWV